MSAASNVADLGGGVKNLAIGAGILTVLYLLYKAYNSPVAAKVAAAASYATGQRNDASLGSDLYGLVDDATETVKGWFGQDRTSLQRKATNAAIAAKIAGDTRYKDLEFDP